MPLPILSGFPLVTPQRLAPVCRIREMPLDLEAGVEAYNEHAIPYLRNAVIGRIYRLPYHVVVQTTFLTASLSHFQAVKVFPPALPWLAGHGGMSQLQIRVVEVRAECRSHQAPYILDDEGSRP